MFKALRTSLAGTSNFGVRDGSFVAPSMATSRPLDGSTILENDGRQLTTQTTVRRSVPISKRDICSPKAEKPWSPPVLDYDQLLDKKSVKMRLPGIFSPSANSRKKPAVSPDLADMPHDMRYSSMDNDTNMELIREKLRVNLLRPDQHNPFFNSDEGKILY